MRECGLCRLYLVQKSNSVLDFVQLFETELGARGSSIHCEITI